MTISMSPPSALGITLSKQEVDMASDFSSSSSTFVDITGLTITMPSRPNGYAKVTFHISVEYTTNITERLFRILNNGVQVGKTPFSGEDATITNVFQVVTISVTVLLNGQVVKAQTEDVNGAGAIILSAGSWIDSEEISSP